jgi:hypothetical protein
MRTETDLTAPAKPEDDRGPGGRGVRLVAARPLLLLLPLALAAEICMLGLAWGLAPWWPRAALALHAVAQRLPDPEWYWAR